MQGTLAARLDKLALEAAEWKSQADAATAGVKCLADQMAQLEAAAAQTRKQLAAAEQQADARIKNQEAELHLLQETLLELGTAVHASESSEAAWGDSLASVQAEVEHMQQRIDKSMQRMSEALHTDLTRYAGCLSQARAVLSDHAQQLGRLAQLPAQVAGLSEQLLSTQQAEVHMRAELESLTALPAQLEKVSQQVAVLGDRQEAASKQSKQASSRSIQKIEGVKDELETLLAQVSAIAQQDEAVDSRLGAAEVQLECVEQVRKLTYVSMDCK